MTKEFIFTASDILFMLSCSSQPSNPFSPSRLLMVLSLLPSSLVSLSPRGEVYFWKNQTSFHGVKASSNHGVKALQNQTPKSTEERISYKEPSTY
jgi:hypothetical protein